MMRLRIPRWLLGGGALLVLACGSTTSGGGRLGAAGSTSAGGSSGTAGSGGNSSGVGGSILTESPLKPGECGVARTLALPTTPSYPRAHVSRQGNGVVLGPWKTGELASAVDALLFDERGEPRPFHATGSTNDISWPLFLSEPDLALEVFINGGAGFDDFFDSRVFRNLDAAPRPQGNVFKAGWRGSDEVALVPTLDGKRGIFAIWPQGISEPRAAMIGLDGARVGEAHSFPTPDKLSRCIAVVPTEQGGFVSFVDSDDDLRMFELGPDGDLAREAKWPMPSEGTACPALALAEGGLVFLLDRAPLGERADVGLYRLKVDGEISQIALPVPLPAEAREVAMLDDDALVLRWSPLGAELSRPSRGELWPITLPSGALERVPSEPGSIWLDSSSLDGVRTLVQLSCR